MAQFLRGAAPGLLRTPARRRPVPGVTVDRPPAVAAVGLSRMRVVHSKANAHSSFEQE